MKSLKIKTVANKNLHLSAISLCAIGASELGRSA